jgi:hypothetical protein
MGVVDEAAGKQEGKRIGEGTREGQWKFLLPPFSP